VHNQRAIRFYVEKAGAEVMLADNGKIACELVFEAAAHGQPFDLILMDMQMPEMDGYQATAKLRQRGCLTPIVALTAHAMANDRERCLLAGCTDYVSKPIDRRKLIETVAALLEKGAMQPASEANTAKASEAAPNSLCSTLASDDEIIDLVPRFIADLPAIVGRLSAALNRKDMAALEDEIHKLKGAAGAYGFMPLTDVAEEINRDLLQSNPPDDVPARDWRLISQIRSVKGYEAKNEIPPAGAEGAPGGGARNMAA
jgi:CheY-like chemotaxis protein